LQHGNNLRSQSAGFVYLSQGFQRLDQCNLDFEDARIVYRMRRAAKCQCLAQQWFGFRRALQRQRGSRQREQRDAEVIGVLQRFAAVVERLLRRCVRRRSIAVFELRLTQVPERLRAPGVVVGLTDHARIRGQRLQLRYGFCIAMLLRQHGTDVAA